MARLNIALLGATGRMGQAIQGLFSEDSDMTPPAPMAIAARPKRTLTATELATCLKDVDVAIDFTLPEAIERHLSAAVTAKCAYVCGVTGLNDQQQALVRDAGGKIPVLYASNMSPGVTLMRHLVQQAAKALPHTDKHILDIHHANKKDAPSGTAKSLYEAMISAAPGGNSPRIDSKREGDVIGEHIVSFEDSMESLQITHTAKDRRVFAHGALLAAAWIAKQQPGFYSMEDVLGA